MYKKLLIVLSFIGIALGAFADEVVFTASAPKQVVVGQAFRLAGAWQRIIQISCI